MMIDFLNPVALMYARTFNRLTHGLEDFTESQLRDILKDLLPSKRLNLKRNERRAKRESETGARPSTPG